MSQGQESQAGPGHAPDSWWSLYTPHSDDLVNAELSRPLVNQYNLGWRKTRKYSTSYVSVIFFELRASVVTDFLHENYHLLISTSLSDHLICQRIEENTSTFLSSKVCCIETLDFVSCLKCQFLNPPWRPRLQSSAVIFFVSLQTRHLGYIILGNNNKFEIMGNLGHCWTPEMVVDNLYDLDIQNKFYSKRNFTKYRQWDDVRIVLIRMSHVGKCLVKTLSLNQNILKYFCWIIDSFILQSSVLPRKRLLVSVWR